MSESPDNMEALPNVPVKPILPAIPTDGKERRELEEDLRAMGCVGLLDRPWNVPSEDTLREFLFQRGNQWDKTERRDLENWTPDTWCEVYGFRTGISEGWAGRKDGLCAGKFSGNIHPKEGLHPEKCTNPRERRMLEFMMPILNPEKPKRITLTVANTLFGALSGVRPVNWGQIIHDYVELNIPYIGQKPSYLSPFIIHLYSHFGCTTVDEDDLLIAADEEIRFRVQPMQEDTATEDPPQPDSAPYSPDSPPESSRRAGTPPPPSPRSQSAPSPQRPPPSPHAAGPSRPGSDMAKRGSIHVDFSEKSLPTGVRGYGEPPTAVQPAGTHHQGSQRRPTRLRPRKHTPGDRQAGGPEELDQARREHDRTKEELERVQSANAHLTAQVSAMTKELNRKTEEIRKHHVEQTVVFQRIRELIGQPAESIVKARLFDELIKNAEPYEARKTLPILVDDTSM